MKVAYVSGPYRSQDGPNGILANIVAARAVAIELWRMGYAVICPHTNTALMDGAADDSVWLAGDLEILKRCDLIVMVPGWEESKGAISEYKYAVENLDVVTAEWPRDRADLAWYAKEED